MKRVIKRLFGEEFNNLLFMNLITAALCIPVVTIGPALLALTGTLIKIMDDRCHIKRLKEYFATFKKKFWKGVLFELLIAVYGFIIVWCTSLAAELGDRGTVLALVAMIFGVLAAIISVVFGILLACTEMPFLQTLWNAVCITMGRFPRALLSALCVWGILIIAYLFYPISVVFLIIICISMSAVLSLAAIWPALDALVLSCYEEEPEPEEHIS